MGNVSLSFAGRGFVPLPCGALFWPAESLLLVADLHLEKGSAFARRGWLLPPHDSLDTLQTLVLAIGATGATRLVALGDSFDDHHGPSRMPEQAQALLASTMSKVDWLWVMGNHDGDSGASLGGNACTEMEIGGIALRHEAMDGADGPEISGHYHPKVSLVLRTGRRVARRCIALAPGRMVLPAYGAYAGGLSVDDPAFVAALGASPEAVVALADGLIRIPAHARKPDGKAAA